MHVSSVIVSSDNSVIGISELSGCFRASEQNLRALFQRTFFLFVFRFSTLLQMSVPLDLARKTCFAFHRTGENAHTIRLDLVSLNRSQRCELSLIQRECLDYRVTFILNLINQTDDFLLLPLVIDFHFEHQF